MNRAEVDQIIELAERENLLTGDPVALAKQLKEAMTALENIRDGKVMTLWQPTPESAEDHLDATQDYARRILSRWEAP